MDDHRSRDCASGAVDTTFDLVERAKTGKRDSTVVKFTPEMAAILFFEQNHQNREWSAGTRA